MLMNKMVAILSAIVAIFVAAIIVYVGTIEEQPDTAERETLAGTEKEPLTFEQQILKQRIDAGFEPADCQTVSVQKFGELYYDGPLIDTHWHIASIPDSSPYAEEDDLYKTQPVLGQSVRVTDIICTLEQENVTKVFAFFPVYKEIRDQQVEVVRRTIELYPDTFVPFLMPPDNDGSADGFPTVNSEVLNDMLEIQPGLFEGYGEIGLYARNGGAPELLPDSQRLQEIYPVVREHGLTVYFHLGEGHKESFERILDENPDINFIWHGDQLISYVGNHQDLSEIEEILYNHPNVYYGVDELYGDVWLLRPAATKQEFLDHFDDYESLLARDLVTWKGFIERHPDQIIWGTDRGALVIWSVDEEVGMTLTNYAKAFIAHLDPEVQEKFAYKNAERAIAGN